jgi:hypothetical protein
MRLVETFGCAITDPRIFIADRCIGLGHLPVVDWRTRRYRNFRS